MTRTIAHFVFSDSGARSLRQALKAAGRNDQVVTKRHNLNLGPIEPSDTAARSKWLNRELGWPESEIPSERDWDNPHFPDHRKVAWLSRRSAYEYAGFLDWAWHQGDTPFDVVDLSEVFVAPAPPQEPFLVASMALLHEEHIRDNKLWDLAKPLPIDERLRYRELWSQLILENAPLRVVEVGELVSAEISYFDSLLMALASDHWQLLSRIAGTALALELDNEVINVEFHWLQQRLLSLVESGQLEMLEERGREEKHLTQLRLAHTRRRLSWGQRALAALFTRTSH